MKYHFQKYYLLLIVSLVLITFCTNAQTTHINATTNGGFEAGSTFTSNGWAATTGTSNSRNSWICSTNATSGYSVLNCAYITRRNDHILHEYNGSNARVSHLYRTISIPTGEININLNFDFICDGESGFDYLTV